MLFVIGMVVGSIFSVITMCLAITSKNADKQMGIVATYSDLIFDRIDELA